MGAENSKNGKKPKPRVKMEHPSGQTALLDKERWFDVEAIVRIRAYGNPEKETEKYIATLRQSVDAAFAHAEVEPVLVLP